MSQANLYDERLKNLQREVHNLKTTHFKTATTISTMTATQTLNFSLMLDSLSGNVFSTQRAIITLATTDNTDMINACYINNITPDNLNDRFVNIIRLQAGAGLTRFGIAVFSQNITDIQTLLNGGSVNLTYTAQLVGSSNFTTTVEYRSITGGTA